MPSSNSCWGVEVGYGAVKAIKLEATGDGARVLEFAVIPHKRVLSDPELDQQDALRVAVGTLASRYNLSGAMLAVSVPGHSAFARFAKLPPVEPRKVPDIVKFEAVQQIPFPIEEVEWDYQTFVSSESPDVEVGIFAITRDRIMQMLSLYQDVHLVPDIVTLSPLAAYNALAYDLEFSESTPGTIILDVGTVSTDLIVAEAGRVWVRTFPIGGHHFTEALVSAFKLSYTKAERLKREAQQSPHARHIFQAMRPVFADLAQDVQRSIGYYQSLHRQARLVRLIGLGSTFRLPGLRKYLKQQLQLNVYRVEQFKRLHVDGPSGAELQQSAMNLCTAYGLALQGLGLGALEANLMPAAVLRQAMWQQKAKWFGVAAGLAVAASAAMFVKPFMISQAVAGAPVDPIVADALREAKRLKDEAEARGVLRGGQGDFTAANILALFDRRDIYPRIVDDLGAMLAFAQQRLEADSAASAPPGPAFVVREFATEYVPPATVIVQQAGGRRGRGRDTRQIVQTEQAGRIRVTLRVTTAHPDPQRFVIETLDAWLRDNATREGLPYTITRSPADATRLVKTDVVSDPAATGPTAGQPKAPTTGITPTGRTPFTQPGVPPPGPDVIIIGEVTRPTIGRSPTSPAAGQYFAELDKLAPIPPRPPEAPPGARLSTFELRWELELAGPADETGGRR